MCTPPDSAHSSSVPASPPCGYPCLQPWFPSALALHALFRRMTGTFGPLPPPLISFPLQHVEGEGEGLPGFIAAWAPGMADGGDLASFSFFRASGAPPVHGSHTPTRCTRLVPVGLR